MRPLLNCRESGFVQSHETFDRIRDALDQEIQPPGILEQMYVEDIAYLTWEVLRLRRSKAAIVNLAFRDALKELITQLLLEPDSTHINWGISQKNWTPKLKSRSRTYSESLAWMRVPLKRKRLENRQTISSASTINGFCRGAP